jgi:hypothetical protein
VLGEAVEDQPRLRAELATMVEELSARRWAPPP